MVCIMCLLPLFLVPIVNLLPLLFYYIMGKVYALFGWEYRKPERVPPACPYKPGVKKDNASPHQVGLEGESVAQKQVENTPGVVDSKED